MAELQERLPVLFDKECEVTVVLYLGLCNAAGWVTFLGGKKVVLLGVEKVLELNWDSEEKLKALLYHEIGHIWHEIYGTWSSRRIHRAGSRCSSSGRRELPWYASRS